MSADDGFGYGMDAAIAAPPGTALEVVTRRTITATSADRDGMTLDEIAGFLRRAMISGLDPDTAVRVRTTRKGVVVAMSVEGVATGG